MHAVLNRKEALPIISILAFFAVFYSLLSLVPHWNYQTNAFDLGIFNQALRQYANFQLGPNTVRGVPTLLADHLELYPLLISPLYWIFGSYTLLIFQILATLLGGLGVYLFVKKESSDVMLGTFAMLIFFLFFGLITALAFDFHNNVVATMLVPYLLLAISHNKIKWFYVLLALFLISKENMALISAFLGISLIAFGPKGMRKHGVITFFVSVTYFLLSLKLIAFLNNNAYDHWPYTALGSSPGEALQFIFLHPIKTAALLVNDPVKVRMWFALLMSGGILALLKPRYALLMVPVVAQKFFSDMPAFWGYVFHYSVEFAPLIAIGAVLGITVLVKKKTWRYVLACGVVLVNVVLLGKIQLLNGKKVYEVFTPTYYQVPYSKKDLATAIRLIPKNASISAQNTIVPHLINSELYHFPDRPDSDYIIVNVNDRNAWPLTKETLNEWIQKFKNNPQYESTYEVNGIFVWRKI